MAGRCDPSRMTKCTDSMPYPSAVRSSSAFWSVSSATGDTSTTL